MATPSCKTKQPNNKCPAKPATPVDPNYCDITTTNGHSQTTNGSDPVPEEHFSYIKRVGSYLVGRTLGEGSFAKVRLGLHLPTAEKVAIKVLDKHRAANDSYMEMTIRREGRLLRRIRPHPNIVQLYEIMETANSLYLVLELCEGGDFLDLVASRGRLSESECRMFLRQIIDAVAHMHSFGILHRDLKIENFMLDSTLQQIKIIDLGLSTAAPGGSSASRTQCGSPAYAAPELIRSPNYGPEVDVWSIGVDMFAMLTGGLPFTVEPFSIKNLYAKMMAREMNPLPSDTTSEAIDLLHRLLEPDPRLRITLQAALAHPWLRATRRPRYNVESKCAFPQPNSIKIINGTKSKEGEAPVDPSVLDLSVATRAAALAGSSLGSLLRDVAAAVPSNLAATYHLLARHMKKAPDQHQHDPNNQKQPNCTSPLSSDSTGAIPPRYVNNNVHYVVKGHVPNQTRRFENGQNIDMGTSFIAASPKPCVGGLISNMTRVTVANHNSLHRPAKITEQPHSSRNGNATPEFRPHSTNHGVISTSESEPGGTQTLERRRLRQPRLAPLLKRHNEEEEEEGQFLNNGDGKNSVNNVPLTNCNGDTRDGDYSATNDEPIVQTARYVGTSAPPETAEIVRWAGDGVGLVPQCLLTSCCGELPIKAVPGSPFFSTTPQRCVPSSTPTPPSCMQVSHIATKGDFCQSPQLNGKQKKPSGIAMFGCVGREQRRLPSNMSDFVFATAKKQSYTPDVEHTPNVHHSRLISSKTPPPPVAVLTPVINVNQNAIYHHNGYQMTAAALIVKPAVQAVAAAARRVLCGASPQPNIVVQHGTLDRRMMAAKQAAA